MPNNECPKKDKITADARKALADLKRVTDEQQGLDLKLKSVKDTLTVIAMDNHKALQICKSILMLPSKYTDTASIETDAGADDILRKLKKRFDGNRSVEYLAIDIQSSL